MPTYNINDEVSSYECGRDVEYKLCDDNDNYDCYDLRGHFGAGAIRSTSFSHTENDKLTVLKLSKYDEQLAPKVTLFEDSNCRGRSGTLAAGEDAEHPKEYQDVDLKHFNI